MAYNSEFMKEAIRIAVENVKNGTGGPFGAVVVRDGEIIATSGNTVVPDIYWARPERVYYACTKDDAAAGGFDDSYIYKEIALDGPLRFIPFENKREEGAGEEFALWQITKNKVKY